MKSWCFVGNSLFNPHYKFISEKLINLNVENNIEFLNIQTDELSVDFFNQLDRFDFVLFDENFNDQVFAFLTTTYLEFEKLNSIDILLKEKTKTWWPSNCLREAFEMWLSTESKDVGVTAPAFLIGSNGLARSVLAGICLSGFSEIVVTDTNIDRMNKMVEDFKSLFFNLKITAIPPDHVTLLAGVHSLVVNTMNTFTEPNFHKELFYCNFLKKGASVIDLNRYPIETPLLKLSKGIGAHVFSGTHFFAFHDVSWIKKVFGKSLDVNEIKSELDQIYSKIAFDKEKLFDLNF